MRDVSVRSTVGLSPEELSATSATYPMTRNKRVLWFPCDCVNILKWGRPINRRSVPLRRDLEHCSHDSAGHDGTEGNCSKTAVDAHECCNKV